MVIGSIESQRNKVLRASQRDRPKFRINKNHWHYKNLYKKRWLDVKRPYPTPQLNLCHYLQVLLLWIPGRAIAKAWNAIPFKPILAAVAGLAAAAGVLLIAITDPMWLVWALAGIAGIAYILFSGFLVPYFWKRFGDQYLGDLADIDELPGVVRWFYFGLCGLPALIIVCVGYGLLGVLIGFVTVCEFLFDTHAIHRKVGMAIWFTVVGIVKTLNWHPKHKYLLWLRPWLVLPPVAWAVYTVQWLLNNGEGIDWWYFAVALGLSLLAATFAMAVLGGVWWAYWRRQVYKERLALLQTEGFVEWIWNSSEAHRFRSDAEKYYNLYYGATAEQMARKVWVGDIFMLLKKYHLSGKFPIEKLALLPEKAQREIIPDPNAWRRTKAAWAGTKRVFAAIWLFLVGTWALVVLCWSYLVYAKRVGICPILIVEEEEPAQPVEDEPVAA